MENVGASMSHNRTGLYGLHQGYLYLHLLPCSWLQIQKSRVRFPALPDFLRSSVSGMGSTQPRRITEELL
jgi:hypothetical protein